MASELAKRPVVNNATILILAQNGRLHTIVEDFARHAADRLERGSMARQYGLHRLTLGEARPDQPGEAYASGEGPLSLIGAT